MNRKAEMERLKHSAKKKYSSYYDLGCHKPIRLSSCVEGKTVAPVSGLLALFGKTSTVSGKTEKSEVHDGPTLTKTRF